MSPDPRSVHPSADRPTASRPLTTRPAADPTDPDEPPTTRAVAVTFEVPAGLADHAELIAEFTSWTPVAMDRLTDGRHRVRVLLPTGRSWGYQYVLDDRRVVNDPRADEFVPGPNGGHVSVIRVPPV